MNATRLSPSQQRILKSIRQYRATHDFAPGVRDIARNVGRSISTVKYHIDRLEELGVIAREPRISRTTRALRL